MDAVFFLILTILELYMWVVFIAVIMSWLIQFNVINIRNQFVAMVYQTVTTLTEPVFRPVRQLLPSAGGLDLSPLVVLLGIMFTRWFITMHVACWLGAVRVCVPY